MRYIWSGMVGGVLLSLSMAGVVLAGNPVIKDRFTADPATLVHDGRVYLYVGHDEAAEDGDFFVLREWSIYSSDNLKDWTLEGAVPRTTFDWGKNDTAWAAQAIERDGDFYWYVTVLNDDPDPAKQGFAIGVAKADNPVDGWQDAIGEPLVSPDMTQSPEFMGDEPWDNIDPTVFIDNDGQAYLYWGNTHLYYARLKDNMVELDGDIHQVEIQNMPGTFTEAPWLHEYQGQYYLSFAMNYPEELAYAVSDSPAGPWEYQGLIMDVLDDSGTSHQAVLEYEDKSYLVYHTAALPTGGNYRRSVSIEHLHYNDDGSIQKITPTAVGIHYEARKIEVKNGIGMMSYQSDDAAFIATEADDTYQQWHLNSLQDSEHTLSFQPNTMPGFYLAKVAGELTIHKHDGSDEFTANATFERIDGLADNQWNSYRLVGDPDSYLMLKDGELVLGHPISAAEKAAATFRVVD
ncbi:family 43 glycosylhydrolase [Aliidiomarina soli]|uniref:Xylosidase/arabinosidase n=1 Tax=Aliidiomarina soli TaxID=1928574 RepID=A0A432WF97_9GAMM|nr:family 43 glycosylhydrolase [Aliidiomarina soli]RUO32450.1 xylosidase/arabinosidase [Aliidiomarina soli]